MTATLSSPLSAAPPAWYGAFARPAREFGPAALERLEGEIPPELNGSLYVNGTGRLQRGGRPVAHWFDGDGAILGLHFRAGTATGLYRYVRTQGFEREEQSGRYQSAGYGAGSSGPLWERFYPLKNAANTSAIAFPDRLLALWEGGAAPRPRSRNAGHSRARLSGGS